MSRLIVFAPAQSPSKQVSKQFLPDSDYSLPIVDDEVTELHEHKAAAPGAIGPVSNNTT